MRKRIFHPCGCVSSYLSVNDGRWAFNFISPCHPGRYSGEPHKRVRSEAVWTPDAWGLINHELMEQG